MLYLAGALAVLGSLGLFRFPDFFTRVHACTVISVGGVYLAILALAAQSWLSVYTVKALLVLAVMLVADPTVAHAIARSSLLRGEKPARLVKNEAGVVRAAR